MPVNAVGRHVQRAIAVPVDPNLAVGEINVLHLCERFDPINPLALLTPKRIRIRNRGRIHRIIPRKINMRSRGHSSGFIMIATKARPWLRKLFYESSLEKSFAVLAAVQTDVVDIVEQPKAVVYTKACGRKGKHTFDFLIRHENGDRTAVAIKPFQLVERLNFRETLSWIKAATPKTFADHVLLVTDRDIDPEASREAIRDLMLQNRSLMEAAQ